MKIAPVSMWAVVAMQRRSQWIMWHTIRRTRKAAADEYLADWLPEYQAKVRRDRNKRWRVARVLVTCEQLNPKGGSL